MALYCIGNSDGKCCYPPNKHRIILVQAQAMGLLSREHFWVIALPDRHCSNLLKKIKVKDTNILVVQPLPEGVEDATVCHNKATVCTEPAVHVSG